MSIEFKLSLRREQWSIEVACKLASQGVTALFGASGIGKTTLLRSIAGLDRHANAFVTMSGTVWQNTDTFVPVYERAIGYVFQEPSLFPHLNVRENILYGVNRTPASEQTVSVDEVIDLFGLHTLLHRNTAALSGGEQQKVALARAIASSPQLLLLDEPLSALDSEAKHELLGLLQRLPSQLQIPMLYVSHAIEEVARLADEIVYLQQGTVLAHGPTHEILSRLDLPISHSLEAGSILNAKVAAHEDDYGLTELQFDGGRFSVARSNVPVGASVRVRIAARDVSITLEHQSATSILNIFPATVDAITEESRSQVTVRLKIKDTPLLCRITKKSVDRLGLIPGMAVFAQVKVVALLQ